MEKKIDQYIDEHFDEMLDTLRSLIQIPSYRTQAAEGKPYGEKVAQALDKALYICKDFGFETHNFDHYMGTVTFGENPELGILFHLDVVPEGDGWTLPPYEGVIQDGRMYGRGTIDDKGPGVASIFALRAIKELGIPLKKGVRLLMGTDEECGSSELPYYLERESMPPQLFTPDSAFPVINTEKGMVRYSFEKKYAKETADRMVLEIHGGETVNAIPAKATAVVTGFTAEELSKLVKETESSISFSFEEHPDGIQIIAEGTSAHASVPETGDNALTGLLKLLVSLPLEESEGLRTLRSVYELFPYGDFKGTAIGLEASDGDRSGDLTLTFSILEYTPESLSLMIDIRFPVTCTCDGILSVLNKTAEQFGMTGKSTLSDPPHEVPEDSEMVKALTQVYSDYTGDPAACNYSGGGTYVHHLYGVAFGPVFEGHPDNHLHGADEFISLEELRDITKIYARAILKICG